MHILVTIGAGITALLGLAHAVFTARSSPSGGPLTPTNPRTRAALDVPSGLGMAPDIDSSLWKAWVGFNLSHALGVVAVSLFIAIPAAVDYDAALDRPWWVVLALALPPIYLAISVKYWFRDPTVGIAVATTLITVGIIGGLL